MTTQAQKDDRMSFALTLATLIATVIAVVLVALLVPRHADATDDTPRTYTATGVNVCEPDSYTTTWTYSTSGNPWLQFTTEWWDGVGQAGDSASISETYIYGASAPLTFHPRLKWLDTGEYVDPVIIDIPVDCPAPETPSGTDPPIVDNDVDTNTDDCLLDAGGSIPFGEWFVADVRDGKGTTRFSFQYCTDVDIDTAVVDTDDEATPTEVDDDSETRTTDAQTPRATVDTTQSLPETGYTPTTALIAFGVLLVGIACALITRRGEVTS